MSGRVVVLWVLCVHMLWFYGHLYSLILFSLIECIVEGEHAVAESDRQTTPYMTKYERARVLGTRALQIR